MKEDEMWKIITIFYVALSGTTFVRGQFFECHDNPVYEPEEGPLQELQFSWLGTLQYLQIKTGAPHYFRVPRVVLIYRNYALCLSSDAAKVPLGYALGNVIFGDYERDEEECKITVETISSPGSKCEPAILLMPIADVILHPKYKSSGTENTPALLKLITNVRSKYVLPACIPFKNYLRTAKGSDDKIFHIDFSSDVPRDFVDEQKDVLRLKLLPMEFCLSHEADQNSTAYTKYRMACSTSCGFHSGAPSMVHEHTGHWSVVALAVGGPPCPDPLRPRSPPPPPRHVLVHPYVPWITNSIIGRSVAGFDSNDPFGYTMPRATAYERNNPAWIGHWWMGGIRCYDRGSMAEDMFKFYHEVFVLTPHTSTYMKYYLEIESVPNTLITCVKMGIPYRLGTPMLWDLETSSIKLHIPVIKVMNKYMFVVEAWASNATQDPNVARAGRDSCSEKDSCALTREEPLKIEK